MALCGEPSLRPGLATTSACHVTLGGVMGIHKDEVACCCPQGQVGNVLTHKDASAQVTKVTLRVTPLS